LAERRSLGFGISSEVARAAKILIFQLQVRSRVPPTE
jgi:hypothetical protein